MSEKIASFNESDNTLRKIPVDREICEILLSQLTDQAVKVDKLTDLVSRDPVLLLEMVAAANGLKNIAGGKAVIELKGSLLALGLERIGQIVQMMAEVTPHYDGDQEFWLKVLKQKCRRTGAVSSIIAEMIRPDLKLESYTVGSLAFYGDLIALAKLGERFMLLLDEGGRRSKIKYRLSQDYHFLLEEETCEYLKSRTVPQSIPKILDPESTKLMPDDQALKAICFSATEFVDAFVEERLDRMAPGVSIPPKSYRRMLQLDEDRYRLLYEKIANYLEKGEMANLVALTEESAEVVGEGLAVAEEELEDTEIIEIDKPTRSTSLDLNAFKDFDTEDEVREIEITPRRKYVSKSDQALPRFIQMFEDTTDPKELLQRLLDMLVRQPPFQSAAILVISPDIKKAKPVIHRGRPLTKDNESIDLTDPLSPLLNLKSKVVSYSPRNKSNAPFGCGNYALAPINAKHSLPVALYADCGDGNILTFESRRLFRKVIDILNNVLPELEDGIPNENGGNL